MTAKDRLEELIRGSFPPGLTRSVIWDAIEAAIKEAKAPLHVECNALCAQAKSLEDQLNECLILARELAAKHVRGTGACTACYAAAYMGSLKHNDNCPVLRLEAFK